MGLNARLTCGVATLALMTAAGAANAQTAPVATAAAAAQASAPAASSAQSGPSTVQEVVVTGYRASAESAQRLKEHASQIVDSIVAADIGKLPDVNTAEALQRVTGVQINRDLGEGGTVVVRGLSQVESLINGREVFTASGTRTLNFEFVPAELLAGVDVYKAQSADLVEGGLGGTIDLRLHRPFDFSGFTASGSVTGNYGNLAGEWKPQVSGLVSDRWETPVGDMGLLLSGSYQERSLREDYVSGGAPTCFGGMTGGKCNMVGPHGYYNPTYTADRQRTGFNGAYQWRPSQELELYLEGSYERFDTDQIDYGTYPQFFSSKSTLASDTLYPGTNIIKTATFNNVPFNDLSVMRNTRDVNETIAAGGKWKRDRLTVKADLSYLNTTELLDYRELDLGTTIPTLAIDTSTTPPAETASGIDLTKASNFNFAGLTDSVNKWEGGEGAFRTDANYRTDWGALKSVDFGGRVAEIQDKLTPIRYYNPTSGIPASGAASLLEMNPTGAFSGSSVPEVNRFLIVNPNDLANFAGVANDLGVSSTRTTQSQGIFAIHERDWEIYSKANLAFNFIVPIDGNVGLRLIDTQDHVTGTETIVGTPTTYQPIAQTKDYAALLPSLNLRAHLTDDLFLRFAASKSITRPEFSSLNPGLTIVPANQTGNQGNPGLQPYRADNYDLALEWYFAKGGSLYGTAFYKQVTGFPFTKGNWVDIGGTQYLISQPTNSGTGKVEGLEAGYQQFFTFLPGWLDGLGAQANVTYVDSSVPTSVSGYSAPLPNLSRWSYNLTGMYQKGPISARVAWNWRSNFLAGIGPAAGVGVVPTMSAAYGQLDAALNYDVSKHITLSLEGTNLTQTKRTYYVQTVMSPAQTFQDDTQVLAGVHFKW